MRGARTARTGSRFAAISRYVETSRITRGDSRQLESLHSGQCLYVAFGSNAVLTYGPLSATTGRLGTRIGYSLAGIHCLT
jgi:hypothetical protein